MENLIKTMTTLNNIVKPTKNIYTKQGMWICDCKEGWFIPNDCLTCFRCNAIQHIGKNYTRPTKIFYPGIEAIPLWVFYTK